MCCAGNRAAQGCSGKKAEDVRRGLEKTQGGPRAHFSLQEAAGWEEPWGCKELCRNARKCSRRQSQGAGEQQEQESNVGGSNGRRARNNRLGQALVKLVSWGACEYSSKWETVQGPPHGKREPFKVG